VLVRLNYAVDLRYGVLVDLAQRIAAGQPVDVTMGYLNCIWQRDANDMIIRSLALAEQPMRPLNLTGTTVLPVRALAERLGELMDRPVEIVGEEAPTALLSDASQAVAALGAPSTPLDAVLRWTAEWVSCGQPTLGKPTRFEVRDGHY
jgi:nucleoside-diphosphate-sugar epimerase